MPQATAREFARSVAAVAEMGLHEREEPDLSGGDLVQILELEVAGGLEVDHVFVIGLREPLPPDDDATRRRRARQLLYVAISRARERVCSPTPMAASAACGCRRYPRSKMLATRSAASGWRSPRTCSGPAETLHSTFRLLRDELMDGTARAAGRLADLRLDTDLDISHAVVRYLEMLKLAAVIARAEQGGGQGRLAPGARRGAARHQRADRAGGHRRPARDLRLVAARSVPASAPSAMTPRAPQVIAARDEPSLQRFLPMRGEGRAALGPPTSTPTAPARCATSSRASSGSRASRRSTSVSGSRCTRCSSATTRADDASSDSAGQVGPLADPA